MRKLTDSELKRIQKGIENAKAGRHRPYEEVLAEIEKKLGLFTVTPRKN